MYAEKHLQTTLDICAILIQRDFCQCPFSISLLAVRFWNMSAILPHPTMRMHGMLYNDTIAPLNLIGIIQPLVSLKNRKRWWLFLASSNANLKSLSFHTNDDGRRRWYPVTSNHGPIKRVPITQSNETNKSGRMSRFMPCGSDNDKNPEEKEKKSKSSFFFCFYKTLHSCGKELYRDNIRQ